MKARTAEQIVAGLLESSEFTIPESLGIGDPEFAVAVAFIREVQDEARLAERARLELPFAEAVRDDRETAHETHITQHPIFFVQEVRRIYGMADGYSDRFVWVDDSGENAEPRSKGSRKLRFRDEWVFVQPFFTQRGAERHIEINGHNLREPRVYVASAFRNSEWQEVRAACLEPKQ